MATRGGAHQATTGASAVREITDRRLLLSAKGQQLQTITAQLSLTSAALARLLSVSGAQSNFILASADGSTTVQVRLAVSSVPDGELVLGNGGVVLDWSRGTIASGTRRAALSRMELRLLAALMESGAVVAPREHLISRLWPSDGGGFGDRDGALSVYVCALRKHFTDLGLAEALQTVRGVGYRLQV